MRLTMFAQRKYDVAGGLVSYGENVAVRIY
jgi:hypothetical protein